MGGDLRKAIPWFDRFREQRRALYGAAPGHSGEARGAAPRCAEPAFNEGVGDYAHPPYSSVTIEAASDALVFRYRGMSAALLRCVRTSTSSRNALAGAA